MNHSACADSSTDTKKSFAGSLFAIVSFVRVVKVPLFNALQNCSGPETECLPVFVLCNCLCRNPERLIVFIAVRNRLRCDLERLPVFKAPWNCLSREGGGGLTRGPETDHVNLPGQ